MAYDRDEILLTLLKVVANSAEPVGTRKASQALLERGLEVSESSTSRFLRILDANGWTISRGTKGREITGLGRQYLTSTLAAQRAGEQLQKAIDVRDLQDLLDLLFARKAAESACAYSAARHATDADIANLRAIVARHHELVAADQQSSRQGLNFHRAVAAMSPNKILGAMSDIVLSPTLDHVEAVLDIVLGTQRSEELAPEHHDQIIEALEKRDPQAAYDAMSEHLDAMIQEVEKFAQGANKPLFQKLLALVTNQEVAPDSEAIS